MRKSPEQELWDVAVVGGGASGMMAAYAAAAAGASVILIEKNAELGKKLLITGGGRCNVTNAELDNKKLLAKFKGSGKFLFSPFSQWNVADTLAFFNSRKMPTKEEAEQRVFPTSNSAQSVHDVLVSAMREAGVTILTKASVTKLLHEGNRIISIELSRGRSIAAQSVILATGGISHPETGSTGDGYAWLKALGHSVTDASAALVPIKTKGEGLTKASGVSLKDIKITLLQNDVVQAKGRGKVLLTHVGLSGPAILNLSRDIGELLKYGSVVVELDLLPDQGYEKINAQLQEVLKEHHTKKLKNAFQKIVPPALVMPLLSLAGISGDTACHSVTREERLRLLKTLKHVRLEVKGLLGLEKAVITSGGVSLEEIDFKTMRSQKIENLYLTGDILNINRPSGGYSLQLCWTTGAVAGRAAAASAKER